MAKDNWQVLGVSPVSLLCESGKCIEYASPGVPLEFDQAHLTLPGSVHFVGKCLQTRWKFLALSKSDSFIPFSRGFRPPLTPAIISTVHSNVRQDSCLHGELQKRHTMTPPHMDRSDSAKSCDGGMLSAHEIDYLVRGSAQETIPPEQLSAWLMAAWINGLSIEETRALAVAMRDSGEKFDPSRLAKKAVDKHSTGGVGDKTSFLVAPLAAACGVAVPMISGRALGHTGGTLDKLDSIPGFRSALSLSELEDCSAAVRCGHRQPDTHAGAR